MQVTDRLYLETLVRVGPEQLLGVNRLIAERHYGVAERHTVEKLINYIRQLETRLGIQSPDVKKLDLEQHLIKVTTHGVTTYVPRNT